MLRNRDGGDVGRRLAALRASLGPAAGDVAVLACRVAIGRVALSFAEARARRSADRCERLLPARTNVRRREAGPRRPGGGIARLRVCEEGDPLDPQPARPDQDE